MSFAVVPGCKKQGGGGSTQGKCELNKGDAQRLLSHKWQCRNPIQHSLWVGHPFKRQLPRKFMIHSHDLVWDALHKSGHAIALHAPGTPPPALHLQGIRDKCKRSQRVLGWWAEPCMNARMAGLKLSHPQSSVYGARFATNLGGPSSPPHAVSAAQWAMHAYTVWGTEQLLPSLHQAMLCFTNTDVQSLITPPYIGLYRPMHEWGGYDMETQQC